MFLAGYPPINKNVSDNPLVVCFQAIPEASFESAVRIYPFVPIDKTAIVSFAVPVSKSPLAPIMLSGMAASAKSYADFTLLGVAAVVMEVLAVEFVN